jgi:hypothetical protein
MNPHRRRHILGGLAPGREWINQGNSQVRNIPIKMINQLADILTASSVGLIPKKGIQGDVHKICGVMRE